MTVDANNVIRAITAINVGSINSCLVSSFCNAFNIKHLKHYNTKHIIHTTCFVKLFSKFVLY